MKSASLPVTPAKTLLNPHILRDSATKHSIVNFLSNSLKSPRWISPSLTSGLVEHICVLKQKQQYVQHKNKR
eukprot:9543755-Ditylum_brightwellii.AAC.1